MTYKPLRIIAFLFISVLFVGTAHAQSGGTDPCPAPKNAMEETPNNMARVQEDIDRFILCVERAQLLSRLNKLVEGNIETIDSVLIPPANSLPPLPTSGTDGGMSQNNASTPSATNSAPAPIDESALTSFGQSESFDDGGAPEDIMMEEEEVPAWIIREINGKSGALEARLISSDGSLAKVRQGDVLSDESRVIEISPTSVKIKTDQDVVDLEWVNSQEGGQ